MWVWAFAVVVCEVRCFVTLLFPLLSVRPEACWLTRLQSDQHSCYIQNKHISAKRSHNIISRLFVFYGV